MHQSVRRLAGRCCSPHCSAAARSRRGCRRKAAALPARVELRDVPFFPQEAYQCGPAALATMLGQRGLALTPGQLKDEVFIPGREGSLQLEMVAAARRHGMLVYPLQGGLESVLEEVAAGNPVLVLQNQAFSWWPRWHFAVVVGFDRERRELVLRSGITRRWVTDFTSFESTWKRSGRWAVLTLPGDRLPATAAAVPWLKAASDSEETGHPRLPGAPTKKPCDAGLRTPSPGSPWATVATPQAIPPLPNRPCSPASSVARISPRVGSTCPSCWRNAVVRRRRARRRPARGHCSLGKPASLRPCRRPSHPRLGAPSCRPVPLAHRPAEAAQPKVVGTPFQRDGSIPGWTPLRCRAWPTTSRLRLPAPDNRPRAARRASARGVQRRARASRVRAARSGKRNRPTDVRPRR